MLGRDTHWRSGYEEVEEERALRSRDQHRGSSWSGEPCSDFPLRRNSFEPLRQTEGERTGQGRWKRTGYWSQVKEKAELSTVQDSMRSTARDPSHPPTTSNSENETEQQRKRRGKKLEERSNEIRIRNDKNQFSKQRDVLRVGVQGLNWLNGPQPCLVRRRIRY